MAIKDYKCLNYLTKWWILNNLNVFEMCVAFHNPYMGRWIKDISILIALGCFNLLYGAVDLFHLNPYMGRWLTLKFTQMELHVHNTYMRRWLTLKFTQMELHVHNTYMGRWLIRKN
jgi:hypothetical protein